VKSMYVRPAATMLPFGRRRACAAPMSAVLASVTVMNAGRWPAWSSATRLQPALRPPEFRPREHRQAQIDHRRVQRLLEPEPVPRRRLADARVARLARLRRQVRHDVPKAAPPGQLRHPIATNWLHRDSLRAIRRPVLLRQPSNSCLGTSLSRRPNIVLLCATAWIHCVPIKPHGRSKPPSRLMGQ